LSFSLFFFKDFKVCFQFYDKNNQGTVSSKDSAQIMRALGLNPSLQEIEDITSSAEQCTSILILSFLIIHYLFTRWREFRF
jgi:Ca2+-binding EF-hand superfamily protein